MLQRCVNLQAAGGANQRIDQQFQLRFFDAQQGQQLGIVRQATQMVNPVGEYLLGKGRTPMFHRAGRGAIFLTKQVDLHVERRCGDSRCR
ncbi:hypothetical protein D3C76_1256850 [compost metagenome]